MTQLAVEGVRISLAVSRQAMNSVEGVTNSVEGVECGKTCSRKAENTFSHDDEIAALAEQQQPTV